MAESFWRLDPSVTFLNHGSFGACPAPVLAAQQALRDELEAEPVRFFRVRYPELLEVTRARLAALVGAEPGAVAFVPNATTGVSTVLASAPLEPGDRVLTTDHAYPACLKALRHFGARRGFGVDVAEIPLPTSGADEIVERVLAAVGPRTRLALIDHVTSPTALVFPIERLVPALQSRGVDVLVDGAHSAGQVPLNLDALGAAYFTGNAHKWLCAPKASAFLVVRADRRAEVAPLVASHFIDLPPSERYPRAFDWTGTSDPTALLAVPAAIDALEQTFPGGVAGLAAANRARARDARALLSAALGTPEPTPDELLGAMAAIALPDAPEPVGSGVFAPERATRLEAGLEDARIQVPLVVWPRFPRRWVRISAQAYNGPADYARLAEVLRALLAEGA